MSRSRLELLLSAFVTVHPHEISALIYSSSSFLFILSAYFVVLPLRDEGAISLGLSNLPGLFVGSLLLTLVAAPVSTLIFSLPNLSKTKALLLIHRFFSVSLVVFFILWRASSAENLHLETKGSVSSSSEQRDLKAVIHEDIPAHSAGWETHSWLYVSVRIGFFLWVALLNLLTISSTWARIIDVMDNESGSRLFGFIGAGATLGQLLGSLFATGFAWLGPYLLLVAALLMELAAQSSKGINKNIPHLSDEVTPIREADYDSQKDADGTIIPAHRNPSPKQVDSKAPAQSWAILDGVQLILSSNYLLQVSLFLWLSAVVSSFFYFQKVNVVAMTVMNAVGRRKLFGQINSFIAVFILVGQLTMTARILTIAGVTIAICSAPFVAFSNLIAVAVWPTWVVVAISETIRKVTTYVVTRPGRELLFTVVSKDEKYKAKICIDVIIQRLGDATAAGMFKLLFSTLGGRISSVSLYALPVCLLWMVTGFRLGRRQAELAKLQNLTS